MSYPEIQMFLNDRALQGDAVPLNQMINNLQEDLSPKYYKPSDTLRHTVLAAAQQNQTAKKKLYMFTPRYPGVVKIKLSLGGYMYKSGDYPTMYYSYLIAVTPYRGFTKEVWYSSSASGGYAVEGANLSGIDWINKANGALVTDEEETAIAEVKGNYFGSDYTLTSYGDYNVAYREMMSISSVGLTDKVVYLTIDEPNIPIIFYSYSGWPDNATDQAKMRVGPITIYYDVVSA